MRVASAKAKSSEGKITPKAWKQDGAEGFLQFIADVQPNVTGPKGKPVPFELRAREIQEIRSALDGTAAGRYRTVVFCWPRRHGKTVASALIILWRFLTRGGQNIAIVANSQKQTIDTAFKTIRDLILATPYCAALVSNGAVQIQGDKITYAALKNTIQGYTSNAAALYGKKLSIAQVSELHAATSDDAYQVLASCTVDSDDGLTLVDSTVGARSSPLFNLYSIAQDKRDPTLYYSHIFYRDLEDACRNNPPWITADAIRSRAAQMLPAEFAQQHLNLWQSGSNALFPPAILDQCVEVYPLSIEGVADSAAFRVGGGLDRAVGFSLHGDATVTTCLIKVLRGEDEHFFVLDSSAVAFSSANGIKKAFQTYQRQFALSRVAIESYNSQDIAAWCATQDFDHEVVHPTAERQASAFVALYNAAKEGRLHIHPKFEKLIKELSTFEYRIVNDGDRRATMPRFEGARGCKDDFVYSLVWSLYSLREQELSAYELNGIHCRASHVTTARLCALNGGEMLPPCADTCRSARTARQLYRSYAGRNILPMPFHEFMRTTVKNLGAHTMPRY